MLRSSKALNRGQAFNLARLIVLDAILSVVLVTGLKSAAEPTNSVTRPMSLADCIQTALEHNLSIKIERFNPSIAHYNVSLAYAAYEPVLNASGTHSYNLSPGGIDPQNRPFSGTTTESDSFNAGLIGVLPIGLNYSLGGNLADAAGIAQAVHSKILPGQPQSNCASPCLRIFG